MLHLDNHRTPNSLCLSLISHLVIDIHQVRLEADGEVDRCFDMTVAQSLLLELRDLSPV